MASMGFLVRIEPFELPSHRRCFVAELDGRLVGFAGVVPIPARRGWFIEDLLRDPRAPNGSGELLVDAVMSWAGREGCDWLTLGLAPLAGDVSSPLRVARRSTAFLYDFEGLRSFKAKLRPHSWSPIYIAYPPSQTALVSIFDALVAFTRGGLLRFGVRSFLRGPNVLIRALALLLVPWTLLLALAPSERYFMHPAIQWGWVGFDALLALALLYWLKRPQKRLLTILAVAITADAALTALQALLWNVRRARGAADGALIVLGCAAPIVAAALLWGARSSRFREI
jgi:phosphatidylglycerol lysyltransferase